MIKIKHGNMNLAPNIEISNLIKPIIDGFKRLGKEWDNFFEIGLSDYLYNQTDKYYFTNTFLHRSEKVRFKDIYYPIKARYKKLTTNFTDLDGVFDEYKNLTIIGSAGSGKTTLIKHIFLQTVASKKRIPILIELRNLNDFQGDFEKLIVEKILKSKIKPSDSTFIRALKNGGFLFLLDGYDEIFSDKKQAINRQIELFIDNYSNNNFIITARPGSGIEAFPRFHDFQVESLSSNDVKGFIDKIVTSDERKKRINEILQDSKNESYLNYLSNPLLLSMFILAFESHPEIPSRKSSFYRNVFDTLYSKHDGVTKNSFPREKMSRFEREDFEKILSIFSYLTLFKGKYNFTNEYLTDVLNKVIGSIKLKCKIEDLIYDLRTTISILILDGFEYHFPHRSMQEYFTAQFIASLPSDKKQKAYDNLATAFKESSTDYSFHLWTLCQELDEVGFISYFLIPQLSFYSQHISSKNEVTAFEKYIELIEPSIFYNDMELRIYRYLNFHSALIEYSDAYDYDIFASFSNRRNTKGKLLKQIELEFGITEYEEIHDINLENEINTILISEGIGKVVKKIKLSIDKKIASLKNQIITADNNIDELLEL